MTPRVSAASQAPPPGPVSLPLEELAFDDTPRPGEELMRRDEARLAGGRASLLWYAWDRPTLTLGRLQAPQAIDAAACAARGVPVVRRPTGGRAVLHADEWTYGAVIGLDHPVLGGSLDASCRAIVGLVCEALGEAYGIEVDTAAGPSAAASGPAGACFARAFGYEATVSGRKLMGSAQRRAGGVLLQQGSLLVGPGHERLATFLASPEPGAEAALARGAITLSEILGRRPDPAPFRAALARAWREVIASGARSA
jgi:lipoate-protein ligase A